MITQNIPLLMIVLLLSFHSVGAQDIVIALPGQDVDVQILCNVTVNGAVAWLINGTLHTLNDLFDGSVDGHNSNGSNIVVEDIMMNDVRNGSEYRCVILQNPPQPNIVGNLTILYVAGVPLMTPNVMIDFTLTLSWGEPFNNLDPIVSYTVAWNDGTFLQSFSTADITTRSYTITNLTPMTNYTFSVVATNSIGSGEVGILVITTPSGTPGEVPNVMVNEDSERINGISVTLTLSWEKPFSYFAPIISYTVSCSGDAQCPPNFTTTDSSTRSHTITNLTSVTNYTFSVVATNSFDSGKAGVLNYPTPGISQVNGIELQCNPVDMINQCTVTWDWNSLQEAVTNFLIISNVGTFIVPSQNTSHMFPVLSLPNGVENGEVTVIVIAVNELGQGPPSEVARANITANDESDDELSTGTAVAISIVVTFIITLVVTALSSVLITSLYYKHLIEKSAINREGDSHALTDEIKRHDPAYTTASGNITMDTNPAYGTAATIKIDTNPAYATTSH